MARSGKPRLLKSSRSGLASRIVAGWLNVLVFGIASFAVFVVLWIVSKF
jgi:hypothetical protein